MKPVVASRPGFPIRLNPDAGVPSASKKIALTDRKSTIAAKTLDKIGQQKPLSTGLGMDSLAIRKRMVQRLAAQGLTDP